MVQCPAPTLQSSLLRNLARPMDSRQLPSWAARVRERLAVLEAQLRRLDREKQALLNQLCGTPDEVVNAVLESSAFDRSGKIADTATNHIDTATLWQVSAGAIATDCDGSNLHPLLAQDSTSAAPIDDEGTPAHQQHVSECRRGVGDVNDDHSNGHVASHVAVASNCGESRNVPQPSARCVSRVPVHDGRINTGHHSMSPPLARTPRSVNAFGSPVESPVQLKIPYRETDCVSGKRLAGSSSDLPARLQPPDVRPGDDANHPSRRHNIRGVPPCAPGDFRGVGNSVRTVTTPFANECSRVSDTTSPSEEPPVALDNQCLPGFSSADIACLQPLLLGVAADDHPRSPFPRARSPEGIPGLRTPEHVLCARSPDPATKPIQMEIGGISPPLSRLETPRTTDLRENSVSPRPKPVVRTPSAASTVLVSDDEADKSDDDDGRAEDCVANPANRFPATAAGSPPPTAVDPGEDSAPLADLSVQFGSTCGWETASMLAVPREATTNDDSRPGPVEVETVEIDDDDVVPHSDPWQVSEVYGNTQFRPPFMDEVVHSNGQCCPPLTDAAQGRNDTVVPPLLIDCHIEEQAWPKANASSILSAELACNGEDNPRKLSLRERMKRRVSESTLIADLPGIQLPAGTGSASSSTAAPAKASVPTNPVDVAAPKNTTRSDCGKASSGRQANKPHASDGGQKGPVVDAGGLRPENVDLEVIKGWMAFFGMKPVSSREYMVKRLKEINAFLYSDSARDHVSALNGVEVPSDGHAATPSITDAASIAAPTREDPLRDNRNTPAMRHSYDDDAPLVKPPPSSRQGQGPGQKRGRPKKRSRSERIEPVSVGSTAVPSARSAPPTPLAPGTPPSAKTASSPETRKALNRVAKQTRIDELLAEAIRADTDLYERLLLFEPIEISELRQRLTAAQPELQGLGEQRLRNFLDSQGLLFSNAGGQSQEKRRRF